MNKSQVFMTGIVALEPEFTDRREFEPAWDPYGRRFFRGCLFLFFLFERDVPMTPYHHLRSQHCNATIVCKIYLENAQ